MIKDIDNIFNKSLDKKCLLYSGGLDSYIIYQLEKDNLDFILYIDSKSKYSKYEIEYLKKQKLDIPIIIDDRLDLSDVEMSNSYVPLRNLFFSMIAVLHGASDILIGVTSGDRAKDKDTTFKKLTEDVINYQLESQWWHPGSKININMKYKNFTKKDLIEEYIRRRYDVRDLIDKSFSCYHPTKEGKECLSCKPDIRKYTFLSKYIDIGQERKTALRKFYTKDIIIEIKERVNTSNSRGQEDLETLEAIERNFECQK